MNANPTFLIPTPLEIKYGKEESISLSNNWEYITNIKSDRLQAHIRDLCATTTPNEQKDAVWNATIQEITTIEVYPIGKISPRNPLFIQFHPSKTELDPQVVIKNIHWKESWDVTDYRCTDEYHLLIGKFIQLTSRSERGLFYGLQTLKYLIQSTTNSIPFQTIHDAPALSLRAIHIDLKKNCPKFSYLKDLTSNLASFKINMFVVEWEDKFPFTGDLTHLCHPAHLTKQEHDEWQEWAFLHYLEMIPLIQSLGHFNYVLEHEQYQHLSEMHEIQPKSPREKHLQYYMFCPLKNEAKNLILEIHKQINEAMGVHQASKYRHIGLDETYNLGACSKCHEYVEQHEFGKAQLYMDHLNWIGEYYLRQEKRPIFWGDMLYKHPDLIESLNPKIIVNDWVYIEKKSENYKQSQWFKAHKLTVLAGNAVQCCFEAPFMPFYARRIPNILSFNQVAINSNHIGSLCTNWVIREGFWTLLDFGFLLHAETTWNKKEITEAQFAHKFWRNYFYKQDFPPKLKEACKPSDLLALNTFFSRMSYSFPKYPQLVNGFAGFIIDSDRIHISEIKSEVFPQISLFNHLFSAIMSKAPPKYHLLNFQTLKIFLEYQELLRMCLESIPKMENIAIKYEEEAEFPLPSEEEFETLITNAEHIPTLFDLFHKHLEEIQEQVLHPAEIEYANQVRIAPLKEHISTIVPGFLNLAQAFSKYHKQVMEYRLRIMRF